MKRLETNRSYKKVWNTPEIQPMEASMTENFPKSNPTPEASVPASIVSQYVS